jgi:redox-sensing transcriptional repressor
MVIKRMPRYYRYIRELKNAGVARVSSQTLARMMNVTASQIRQDFNCFGGFGQQGYGYNVEYLYNKMVDILCLNNGYRAIILGAGNLGSALVHSPMFPKVGVSPVAMFDVRPELIGKKIADIPVFGIDKLEDFCKRTRVDIAILTLSRAAAPEVAKRPHDCGIIAIWNFTNAKLGLDERDTIIESVHMSDSLMTLTYRLGFHNRMEQKDDN